MVSEKAGVRAAALARRAAIAPDDRRRFAERLATVGPRLILDFAPANATLAVALYAAIRSEPDLALLAEALRLAGVVMALPVTASRDEPLLFRRWSPGDALESGPMGVPQPTAAATAVDPDVLLVPLAAFDRRGYRVGYGGGYYDRTLAALRARKTIRAMGVAYAVQEVLFVPSEGHDEPLDLVLTDRETLLCGA